MSAPIPSDSGGPVGVAPARPAATVVLLRQETGGPSVFLVKRSRAVGFMPSAWVFPGGRVDPGDAHLGGLSSVDAAYRGAAIRETLEEAGIWLGEGSASAVQRAREARKSGDPEWAAGLRPEPDRLVPWARWITPQAEPKRFDTRFFVARVDGGDTATHDDAETVDSAWIPVARAVARAEAGALPMAPPTWWTLRELAGLRSVAEVGAFVRPTRAICPILEGEGEALRLILPGHPRHPDPGIPGIPAEIGFVQGRWWASA